MVQDTRAFIVCLHDATPAYARETQAMIRDLAPVVGRRLSFGVVPDWHGRWPLAAHPGYCRLLQESCGELLLHGYRHQRQRGFGPATWLAEGSDEMSGLSPAETRRTLERAQGVFAEAFGAPARGFIAPAWQNGRTCLANGTAADLEYVVGFLSIESRAARRVPLATWTWDCGRWGWLGHVGHAIGSLLQTLDRGVPMLAVHPRDLERGFGPQIIGLIHKLLASGYQPSTVRGLLDARDAQVAV